MFNKLKSTVTGVLPVGNQIFREYDVGAQVASAGPGLFWKVHDACSRSTKQEASVFMFEKKALDRYSKRDKELILETLRRGATQLTKLRHPNILSVLHPLEENRESIAFATEPVFASLANALGRQDNMPSPLPVDLEGFKLYDVEIKYGLFQICEGLCFLHNSVKLIHGNICPNSVMINKNGSWKIAGFDFCIQNANQTEQMPFYPHREWQTDVPPVTQPQLNYLAPEYALTMSCDTSSDMYSIGVLFYALFNYGKPVFDARDEWSTYKGNVESLRRLKISVLGSVPEEIREHIGLLLNTEPSVRPDADQLNKIPFFEDVGAMTLQYLDSLFQRDNLQKSQFFKGLPKVLEKLPKRVNLKRILPSLYNESVNKDMVPFLLPCILLVAEQSSEKDYIKYVLPGLLPLFKLKEPVQILLIFMQNMTLLLQKTPQNDIKTYVLPMVYGALESSSPQIQELCLNIIPTFASLLDFTSMKNSLIPRIRGLCLSTTLLNVRVTSLICIGKLLEYMDKWFVLDDILPILPEIPSREPAVLMSMLGIYKVAMTHKKLGITKDMLANKIVPFLFPVAIDNNLNLAQFSAFMSVIKEMMEKVETEHRAKLEQLSSMQTEQRTIQIGNTDSSGSGTNSISQCGSDDSMMNKMMSGFGLASYFSANKSSPKGDSQSSSNKPSSVTSNGSAIPSLNNIPQPSPVDTKLPNQPAKVSLTLEEKTRLARQQQQQQRLKSQQPINPISNTSATQMNNMGSSTGVKDLTSSLLNTNFMTSASKPSGGLNQNTTSVSSGGINSLNTTTNYNISSTTGMLNSSGTSQMNSQNTIKASNTGTYISSEPDISSFDSLLPSKSANKPTLNQMNSQYTSGQTNLNMGGMQPAKNLGMQRGTMGMQPNQFTSQPMGMTGGMMGSSNNTRSMMSAPSMMGNQGNNMMSQSGMMGGGSGGMGFIGNQAMMGGGSGMGMMGNQGMMGSGNMNNIMGNRNMQPSGSKPLSSHDIDDLLS